MKDKIQQIIISAQLGGISSIEATQQVLGLFGVSVSLPSEEPILIGKLNKIFGYNGFKQIEIGTDVFSFKDRYYFEMIPLNDGKPIIQKFYKETLAPCIDFIGNER
jgi:hypothetical protein